MKKNTKWILGILIIVILATVIISISTNSTTNNQDIIKIGVLADLSGDYVGYFEGIPRGIDIAINDLEEQGYNIQLIMEDQMSCNSTEATKIVNKLINIDQVDFIVGSSCSSATLSIIPIVEESKTIMISPASSSPTITNAGDYIFRTYMSDDERAIKQAELAYDLGYRNLATITDVSNESAIRYTETFENTFKEMGGTIVISEKIIDAQSNSFKTELEKIKVKNSDLFLITITSHKGFVQVLKEAKILGIDAKIFGAGETAENPEVLEVLNLLEKQDDGLIYIIPGNPPETDELKEFRETYKLKYNKDEIDPFSTESYDAVMLGVKAILASDGTKEDIKNKVYDVSKKYQGISGNVTFDEFGDVHKDVLFKQIINGEFVVYNN